MPTFDYIIGNPAFQEESNGNSNTAIPIYHHFMEAAYKVGDAVELITPARFLFSAGATPKQFNERMLNDPHFKVLQYEPDASKVFPSTEIKGGVAITYHDQGKEFKPIGIFTPYPEMNNILEKVTIEEKTIADICFVATKFAIDSLVEDYPEHTGRERRMSSNVLGFSCFHDVPVESNDFGIYGRLNNQRTLKYIAEKYVDTTEDRLLLYKVVIPKADGNGSFGETLTNPEILPPRTGFTHTFLGIGGFQTEDEATALLKYLKTKFARALFSVAKVTQNINADTWRYVPLQSFSHSSDIDWSLPIPEIDQQLYAKYSLDPQEVEFIESHVKSMS